MGPDEAEVIEARTHNCWRERTVSGGSFRGSRSQVCCAEHQALPHDRHPILTWQIIMRRLALELMQKLDDELRQSVAEQAAFFEHRLQEGSKAIFHIEAFVARFMADYKNFLLAAMA